MISLIEQDMQTSHCYVMTAHPRRHALSAPFLTVAARTSPLCHELNGSSTRFISLYDVLDTPPSTTLVRASATGESCMPKRFLRVPLSCGKQVQAGMLLAAHSFNQQLLTLHRSTH